MMESTRLKGFVHVNDVVSERKAAEAEPSKVCLRLAKEYSPPHFVRHEPRGQQAAAGVGINARRPIDDGTNGCGSLTR